MPSASYADPRLAALYDALNPPGAAEAFYLSLPGAEPARILDMGCGTGWLACELAARGHHVTGADPAAAMLAVARARPGGDRVRWVQADAASLATRARFDLIIMTGHVFQLLLDDRAVRVALQALGRHLAPGGRIAFETRNPAVREWQDWNPRDTRQRVEAAGLVADVHYDISAVAGELVTYETCFRLTGAGGGPAPAGEAPDGTVVVPDTLRFTDQPEVAAFLAEAGLTRVTWYGDWDGSPYTPDSPEIIAIAADGRVAGRELREAILEHQPVNRTHESKRQSRPFRFGFVAGQQLPHGAAGLEVGRRDLQQLRIERRTKLRAALGLEPEPARQDFTRRRQSQAPARGSHNQGGTDGPPGTRPASQPGRPRARKARSRDRGERGRSRIPPGDGGRVRTG